jgi:hypothetical protein
MPPRPCSPAAARGRPLPNAGYARVGGESFATTRFRSASFGSRYPDKDSKRRCRQRRDQRTQNNHKLARRGIQRDMSQASLGLVSEHEPWPPPRGLRPRGRRVVRRRCASRLRKRKSRAAALATTLGSVAQSSARGLSCSGADTRLARGMTMLRSRRGATRASAASPHIAALLARRS